MREFNVTGLCIPGKHYMADVSNKVSQIAAMVEKERYFTINRARQYGKTTTLWLLDDELARRGYAVAHISFEGVGDTPFENEKNFCQSLLRQIARELKRRDIKEFSLWEECNSKTFDDLDIFLNTACNEKKLVLMIDETDKTSNNLVFLRFIGMLRDKYLLREKSGATFQSVILCGVYDIKNLKLKMVQAGTHQLQDGEKRINSPWNIAADFKVDMSLNEKEIASMLADYENDHKTGMDIEAISKEIRAYTNGYPYLVSRICQRIDEDLEKDWTIEGVEKAVNLILKEKNTLFDDIGKNLQSNEDLNNLIYNMIIGGVQVTYNNLDPNIDIGLTFGFLAEKDNSIIIANKIFEMLIYNYFISISITSSKKVVIDRVLPSSVIENGRFNMELAIKKFAEHYYELYSESGIRFLESECRMLFLTYIKPLINGNGFCHIESETRDRERMDVVVDFGREQFIVELKLWYGEQSHENAFEQLVGYLESKSKDTGYMLTFDFRKAENVGKPQVGWVEHRGKKILDVMVGV
ncbi:hypothetical protein R83H12_00353 [Fibrobacteria bacterium R8-3-H12]